MRLLCSKSKGLFRLLAKNVEEAGHELYKPFMLSERGNQKMYSDASLFGVPFSMNITK
jgi:hypothetical protein